MGGHVGRCRSKGQPDSRWAERPSNWRENAFRCQFLSRELSKLARGKGFSPPAAATAVIPNVHSTSVRDIQSLKGNVRRRGLAPRDHHLTNVRYSHSIVQSRQYASGQNTPKSDVRSLHRRPGAGRRKSPSCAKTRFQTERGDRQERKELSACFLMQWALKRP
jgi:hypothetical protein